MTNLSKEASRILEALRSNVEGTSIKSDGSVWGSVYLDNARPDDVSPRSFAGHLSALEAAGFYKSQNDNAFGSVLMPVAEQEDEDELDLGEWEPHPEDPDASKIDAELMRNKGTKEVMEFADGFKVEEGQRVKVSVGDTVGNGTVVGFNRRSGRVRVRLDDDATYSPMHRYPLTDGGEYNMPLDTGVPGGCIERP